MLKASGRLQPHPSSSWWVSPHSRRKWIRSWKNTKTYSPHPMGYLCTVNSSTQLIWSSTHHYQMGQFITSIYQKMRKSCDRSKILSKRGTTSQDRHLVESQSCLHRINMGLGKSTFITRP
jgi:hypothetical protein